MKKTQSNQEFCTLGVLLTLLVAGCTVLPDKSANQAAIQTSADQVQSTATSSPAQQDEPTATPAHEEGMLRYMERSEGYTFEYPEEWGSVASGFTMFAERYDDYISMRGPFFTIGYVPLSGDFADFGGTPQEMIDQTLELYEEWMLLSDCVPDEPVTWTFGEPQGVRSEASCENPESRALIGAVTYEDKMYFVLAKAPAESWSEHQPTLERIFASVQFFSPDSVGSNILGEIHAGETFRGTMPGGLWQFQVDEGDQVVISLIPFKAIQFGTDQSGMVPGMDLYCFGGLVDSESYYTQDGQPVPPEQVDYSGVFGMTLRYTAEENGDCYIAIYGATGGNFEASLQIGG